VRLLQEEKTRITAGGPGRIAGYRYKWPHGTLRFRPPRDNSRIITDSETSQKRGRGNRKDILDILSATLPLLDYGRVARDTAKIALPVAIVSIIGGPQQLRPTSVNILASMIVFRE